MPASQALHLSHVSATVASDTYWSLKPTHRGLKSIFPKLQVALVLYGFLRADDQINFYTLYLHKLPYYNIFVPLPKKPLATSFFFC